MTDERQVEPTMQDVIEGRCGCGFARAERRVLHGYDWRLETGRVRHRIVPCELPAYCRRCHYRLDADGYARRMVDATVEDVQERIACEEALHDSYNATAKAQKSDEARQEWLEAASISEGRIDELKRLVPEEAEKNAKAEEC